jgi:aspartyl-tRNA(Asn)/glutamyl-tRNA(Gln) amidotransferase subunit C
LIAMSLSRQEVERVSLLARLRLSDAELDTMTAQLSQVVDYVAQLSELDTRQVAPMAHAVEVANVFRADEVQPSLDRAAALANAPHHDGQFYLVPAVLG